MTVYHLNEFNASKMSSIFFDTNILLFLHGYTKKSTVERRKAEIYGPITDDKDFKGLPINILTGNEEYFD